MTTADRVPFPAGYVPYGGATPSRVEDGAGDIYFGCTASCPDGRFGFCIFKYTIKTGNVSALSIPPEVTGRGTLHVSLFDGRGRWTATADSHVYTGYIPTFVPCRLGG